MIYVIVDIETTGGRTEKDRITDIAIIKHDGQNTIDTYHSLVNPECFIPHDIQKLTGISNDMVKQAPKFYEIAKDIIEFTEGCCFVAHNVRFDYGFVKAEFKSLGYLFQRPTLCTVKLSRSTFKGLYSYSLGNLCAALDIPITDRHRALGDAKATAILFEKIHQKQSHKDPEWLKSETTLTKFPPLLKPETFHQIPNELTGVYYFHNQDGHVIYVGKSIDIKKRIEQHFRIKSNESKRSLQMKTEIADISFEAMGDELIALLHESYEIKRIKPIYNVLQKKARAVPFYGLFSEYDNKGYIVFQLRKLTSEDQPIFTADSMASAKAVLHRMMETYGLCETKCGLQQYPGPCFRKQIHTCKGACIDEEAPELFNEKAIKAIKANSFNMECCFIVGRGRIANESSVVHIHNGQYKGFGFIDHDLDIKQDELQSVIKAYPHNRDIQQILCAYLDKRHKVIKYKVTD